jgi:predicted dehydrogenase
MSEPIRWGIIGTGWIAEQFATGLSVISDAELVAIGSRTASSAHRFADEFGVPHRHASYEALAEDAEVDVVYVATPNNLHMENSLLCLEAGKAVLCEKPFTINAREAEAVIGEAREKRLFLMEAMWTRFNPVIIKLRELLAKGVIGELKMLIADLGFRFEFNPEGRLWNLHLGGGALLDLGVYPVSMASMIFGTPTEIASLAKFSITGVDEQASIIMGYEGAELSTLYTSMRAETPQEVVVAGTRGLIRVHAPMFRPDKMSLSREDHEDEVLEFALEGNGYNYAAEEVMRCLRDGKLESEVMPLDETLSIMETMDQIRAQWGLRYPME